MRAWVLCIRTRSLIYAFICARWLSCDRRDGNREAIFIWKFRYAAFENEIMQDNAASKQTANVETRFNRRTEEKIMSQDLSIAIEVITLYKMQFASCGWLTNRCYRRSSSHINLEIQLWSLHRLSYYCIKNATRKDIIAACLAYGVNESESDFINVKRYFINTNLRII